METPIEVLRVEQNVISKELSRFRACDPETRSLYCREWAQFIYKKHFVWNAKTQEEIVPESQLETPGLTAGKYQINFIHDDQQPNEDENTPKKARSTVMSKKFEELVESWSANPPQADEETLINQITAACDLWITLPSGYSGLPVLFEPVQFNPFPDAIPLVEDEKDPSQLLDPLIIERQALCLPSDCFHLLKNLTGDILLSHTTPTCDHTRPESKQPTDLDTDRIIFNDHVEVAVKTALAELTLALEQAWNPLEEFIIQLKAFESRRIKLMGKGCQEVIDNYFKGQDYVSFVDYWATQQSNFKNKKSTPEEIKSVDDVLVDHLDKLKSVVQDFLKEFVPNHLKEIHVLTTDLWKLIVPTIYEMGERMASHEDQKGNKNTNAARIGESLKALDMESLKKMESTKEFDEAQSKIMKNLAEKVDAYMVEIDSLVKSYQETARPTVPGRLEKLGNKNFKKEIKKLESGYYTIRQAFIQEVRENIFPESLLCKFSLVCLEPLMQEGEVMEALTIEKEVKRFIESHKDLLQQRCSLMHDFEDGVQTGRRELAGVLGKLFLKEGMRIQGDNLALKRQNSLLKSMGQAIEDTTSKKKKNKKKTSAASSVAVSPTISDEKKSPLVKKKVDSAQSTPKASPKVKEAAPKIELKKVASPKVEVKKVASPKVEAKKEPVPKPEVKKVVSPKAEAKKEPAPKAEAKKEVAPKVEAKKEVAPKVEAKKEVAPKVEAKKVVTPKVEPKVVTPKAEPKKVVTPKVEPKVVTPKAEVKKEEAKVEAPVIQQEKIVEDWESLRAQVQKEEEAKKVQARADTWSNVATAATSEVSSPASGWSTVASGGWNTPSEKPKKQEVEQSTAPVEEAKKQDSWNAPIEEPKKQDTWKAPIEEPKKQDSWPAPVEQTKQDTWTAPVEEPKKQDSWNAPSDSGLGGWGETPAKKAADAGWGESAKKDTAGSWGEKTTQKAVAAGWGTNVKSEADVALGGWGDSVKPESKSTGRWSELKKDEPKTSGWGQSKKEDSKWSKHDDSWGNKKRETSWGPNKQDNANGWKKEEPQGWGEQKKTEQRSGWNNVPWDNDKKETVIEKQPEVVKPVAPPGMTMSPNTAVPPPVKNSMMPPGFATNQLSSPAAETPQDLGNLVNNNFATGMNGATQFHEPLPADIQNMGADMLLLIVKNLHRENGTLIQSVYHLQQEMNMITSRYSEIMGLAREREAQTLALFESRKQTEMEEVRRYVLSLEAKVKQLEEQAKGNSNLLNPTTAGFGNQDLFAGYREEMSTTSNHHHHNQRNHNRKMWQKNNTTIRCGNCGEVGHESGDCKGFCRYCGSLEHLSEVCPMN